MIAYLSQEFRGELILEFDELSRSVQPLENHTIRTAAENTL